MTRALPPENPIGDDRFRRELQDLREKAKSIHEALGKISKDLEQLSEKLSQLEKSFQNLGASKEPEAPSQEPAEAKREEKRREPQDLFPKILAGALAISGGLVVGVFLLCLSCYMIDLLQRTFSGDILSEVLKAIGSTNYPQILQVGFPILILISILPSFLRNLFYLLRRGPQGDAKTLVLKSLGYFGGIVTSAGIYFTTQAIYMRYPESLGSIATVFAGGLTLAILGGVIIYPLKLRGPGALLGATGIAMVYMSLILLQNLGILNPWIFLVFFLALTLGVSAAAYLLEMPLIFSVPVTFTALSSAVIPEHSLSLLLLVILSFAPLITVKLWRDKLDSFDLLFPLILGISTSILIISIRILPEVSSLIWLSLSAGSLLTLLVLGDLGLGFKLGGGLLVISSLRLALDLSKASEGIAFSLTLLALLIPIGGIMIASKLGSSFNFRTALKEIVALLLIGLAITVASLLDLSWWVLWGVQVALISRILLAKEIKLWETALLITIPILSWMPYLSAKSDLPLISPESGYLLLSILGGVLILFQHRDKIYFYRIWGWYPIVSFWLWSLREESVLIKWGEEHPFSPLSYLYRGFSTSLLALLGVILLIRGLRRKSWLSTWGGGATLILSSFKLIFVDLSAMDPLARGLLASLVGAILLVSVIGWFRGRTSRGLSNEGAKEPKGE